MYIKNITFTNFGRHEHLALDLTQGLVGIVGPNGSGKSTITDGVFAAITNDFSRFAGVKTDNITDTAGEKEESSIELTVSHQGEDLRILRGIRPGKSRLWIPGRKEPFTKSGDIQREIEERLGINNKLLSKFCFVGQWELFSFLSDTPGDRAKIYQHLCGTEKAQVICDAISDMLAKDSSLTAEVDDNRDELRQEIARLQADAKAIEDERKELLVHRLKDDELDKLKKVIRKRERYIELKADLARVRERIALAESEVKDLKTASEKTQAEVMNLKSTFDQSVTEADEAKVLLSKYQAYLKRSKRVAQLDKERNACKAVKQKLEDERDKEGYGSKHPNTSRLDDIREMLRKCQEHIGTARETVEGLNSGNTASRTVTLQYSRNAGYGLDGEFSQNRDEPMALLRDMYGDLIKSLDDTKVIEAAKTELEEAEALEDELETKIGAIIEFNQDYEDFQQRWQQLKVDTDSNQALIDEVGEVGEPPIIDAQIEDLENAVERRDDAEMELEEARTEMNVMAGKLSKAEGILQSRKEQRKTVRDDMAKNKVEDNDHKEAVLSVTNHEHAMPQIKVLTERIKQRVDEQCDKEEKLEEVQTLIDRHIKAHRFAKQLTKVRDDVLHRQALPQVVAQSNLEDMESDINEVLDMFGSPFWVEASSDLSFHVHFPGEPPKSADRLSGGQKGVLAVAFRIALSSLFKSEIGMMSLDEPTAGMDTRNVDYLAQALTQYASKVRGQRQILMITHAEQLKRAFDQVVDLGDL